MTSLLGLQVQMFLPGALAASDNDLLASGLQVQMFLTSYQGYDIRLGRKSRCFHTYRGFGIPSWLRVVFDQAMDLKSTFSASQFAKGDSAVNLPR